eukprot:COSAG06_NODE_1511_length_9233_cov_3.730896_3_plen_59_part_00
MPLTLANTCTQAANTTEGGLGEGEGLQLRQGMYCEMCSQSCYVAAMMVNKAAALELAN